MYESDQLISNKRRVSGFLNHYSGQTYVPDNARDQYLFDVVCQWQENLVELA